MVRAALVVKPDAEIDDDLLAVLEERTGHRFTYHGSGGFGTELFADVYRDQARNHLVEATAIDAPVKAVVFMTRTPEEAVAIRQVVADHLGAWSEQMLRRQLEQDGLEHDPGLMVAIAMAGAGAPENATVDLVNGALEHPNEEVAAWAAYAVRVHNDLMEPPMVIGAEASQPEADGQQIAPVLRPAEPVTGEQHCVTVRPGVDGLQVPRAVTWLRPLDGEQCFFGAMSRNNWDLAVVDHTDPDWQERVATTGDQRTAVHLVWHPRLDGSYLAVHGDDVDGALAALRTTGGVEQLDGPPVGLEHTAP